MEESILKLQLLEKKDLAEPEIDIRYSSMTQPLNRIVQYIRQQEYLIQGIFEKKLYQIPLNEVLYLSLIHISEPTRLTAVSRMPSSA